MDDETRLRAAIELGNVDAILQCAGLMDAADAARDARLRSSTALAAAAIWYAEHGVPVFPLTPRAKIPLPRSRGFKDATCDVERVRAWWDGTPNANIGAPTGHGYDVVDIDGPLGVVGWAMMLADGRLPQVIGHATTPSIGGNHLFVPTPEDHPGNKASVYPGIDYRGRGGYAVMPPSLAANGAMYRWLHLLPQLRGEA